MSNLHVSCPKISMFLLFSLAILCSCSDQDLFIESVNDPSEFATIPGESSEYTPSDSTVVVENDTTNVNDSDTARTCLTDGGLAGDTGLKTWCWGDIELPEYSGRKGVPFSNRELTVSTECSEKQISKEGDKLKFSINPTFPAVESWCDRDFNMRAEIHTLPWDIRHDLGTEEWFGWSYTLGDDYVIDKGNTWLFFQVHNGIIGDSPHTALTVIQDGQFQGHSAGEIYVVNNSGSIDDYQPTGFTPIAGETLNIVVHAIWGDESNGLLQVWINGTSVYDKQAATVYPEKPWGGNAKWGIYKWPWTKASGVQKSHDQGITHLETYMGPLRVITRRPGDPDYGTNSYELVAPD